MKHEASEESKHTYYPSFSHADAVNRQGKAHVSHDSTLIAAWIGLADNKVLISLPAVR